MIKTIASVAALATALTLAGAADAQTFDFTGTRQNVNPLTPPGSGRCAPDYFNTVNIAPGALSSTGTSNVSNFTSTQSHCIVSAPPTQIADGVFEYRFEAGDTIIGTYSGSVAVSGTPGTFSSEENLIITGGTGRFVGATGTITSGGTLQLAGGNGTFSGTVNGSITATTTTASGEFATAYGTPSAATGAYSSAYGAFSYASGERALAVGSFAEATNTGAVALGDNTFASGPASLAAGQNAVASAPAATAVGHNSVASGIGSFAGGVRAQATGVGAVSVGQLSQATAANSTSIGARATATFAGSTAVGADSSTTSVNQIALGGSGSSVRVGDIAASTAAQVGTVSIATVDAAGTLGRNSSLIPTVAALEVMQSTLTGRIDSLFDLRDVDRRDMRQGIAAAIAMGQASMPSAPGRTSYTVNGSTFRGEFAIGGSIMHRLAGDFAIGAGFSFAGNKNNAARVGVAGEF